MENCDSPTEQTKFSWKTFGICSFVCGLLAWTIVIMLILITINYEFSIFPTNNNNNDEQSPSSSSSSSTKKKPGTFGDLIFDEEFDSFNLTRWKHVISLYGGGNWEFEYYINNRTNSYTRNSTLFIKPTLTNNTFTEPNFLTSGTIDLWGSTPADSCTANFDYGCFRTGTGANALNPVQSARIHSVDSFKFTYGKIEVRAQLPQGDWLWPAVWMIPVHNFYGQWPASGEIDIIEARSNKKLTTSSNFIDGEEIGASQIATTLHWGPYFGANMYELTHSKYQFGVNDNNDNELFSDGFHVFTMEWTPDGFQASMDDTPYFNVTTPSDGYWTYGNFDSNFPNSFNPWIYGSKNAPFDKEFFFVINLACGGTSGFFPDGSISSPGNGVGDYAKPWSDQSSTAYADFWNARNQWYPTWNPFQNDGEDAALKIDYIKVYSYDS